MTPQTTVPEEECDHMAWWQLNARVGCIHPSHGAWPRTELDAYSGLPPVIYRPKGDVA